MRLVAESSRLTRRPSKMTWRGYDTMRGCDNIRRHRGRCWSAPHCAAHREELRVTVVPASQLREAYARIREHSKAGQ